MFPLVRSCVWQTRLHVTLQAFVLLAVSPRFSIPMKSPRFLFGLLAVAVSTLPLAGADSAAVPAPKFPAQSPAATVTQEVGLTKIEVAYSRPGVKGRKIFGGTEAFGRVWRTGANTATKITFSTPVKFGGAAVPAGQRIGSTSGSGRGIASRCNDGKSRATGTSRLPLMRARSRE